MTDLADYYAKAGAWAHDRERSLMRSRRFAWAAAAGIAVIAGLEAMALVMLLPLKTTSTVAMLVDRTTGFTQIVDPAAPRRIRADRALIDSMLGQYVTGREAFDPVTARESYRKVALWSAGAARTGYLHAMDYRNADGVVARVRPGQVVAVRIKSVSLLSPRTAMVRFEATTRTRDGATVAAQSWVAVVGFRFANGAMAVEDQLVNPLGFQVTSYSRDAESAAPRDQGDVM